MKVLYLGGQARSGSTLVDRVLGQVVGVCSAGEVRYLWDRGLRDDQLCGCGESFRSCAFWTEVGTTAFGGWDALDLDEVLSLRDSVDRPGTLRKLLVPRGGFAGRLERYASYLERVYRGIAAVSGSDVVVDSSMSPPHGMVLRHVDGIDLRCVHLVRDPRGVAFSSTKAIARPEIVSGTEMMPTYAPAESSLRWDAANLVFETLGFWVPTTRLRYESFVRDPRGSVRAIGLHLGSRWPEDALTHIHDGSVDLGVGHTAAGNPMRFKTGNLQLRIDEVWRTKLPSRDKVMIGALTWPLLLRYGYAIGGGA